MDKIKVFENLLNKFETEEIKRFQTDRSREELETWFSSVVHEYFKWARYLYHHELTRDASIGHLEFPFPYRAVSYTHLTMPTIA